ncbi:PhaM family polyhydroxyalkanoate granule multifunctional regulatory protein [Azonexus sp. IMCC34839]|uniref:PhaM family polyhydroxyalkanoate granule multifunctional regulatory protein n=1 Tax=Azonexus sp. IMCC34839 TaxID=3133695 RepID=UPI00399A9B19
MSDDQVHDPLNFMRNIWGNMGFSLPGMVAPTFDLDELDKRIKDLKAVEGWLRMNLSMLQMTIQGLEMQRSTVGAVQAMGQMAADAAKRASEPASAPEEVPPEAPAGNAFSEAAMWPWQMMQQMREQMQQSAEAAAQAVAEEATKAQAKPKAAAKPRAKRPATTKK